MAFRRVTPAPGQPKGDGGVAEDMGKEDVVAVDAFGESGADKILAVGFADRDESHAGNLGEWASGEDKCWEDEMSVPAETADGQQGVSEVAGDGSEQPLQEESGEERWNGDADQGEDEDEERALRAAASRDSAEDDTSKGGDEQGDGEQTE